MPLSLSEISLNRIQLKMLKKLLNGKSVDYDKVQSEKYSTLEYYSLIGIHNGKYQITEKGKSYLRLNHKDRFRFWFPIIISVLALILSTVSLIMSFLW